MRRAQSHQDRQGDGGHQRDYRGQRNGEGHITLGISGRRVGQYATRTGRKDHDTERHFGRQGKKRGNRESHNGDQDQLIEGPHGKSPRPGGNPPEIGGTQTKTEREHDHGQDDRQNDFDKHRRPNPVRNIVTLFQAPLAQNHRGNKPGAAEDARRHPGVGLT